MCPKRVVTLNYADIYNWLPLCSKLCHIIHQAYSISRVLKHYTTQRHYFPTRCIWYVIFHSAGSNVPFSSPCQESNAVGLAICEFWSQLWHCIELTNNTLNLLNSMHVYQYYRDWIRPCYRMFSVVPFNSSTWTQLFSSTEEVQEKWVMMECDLIRIIHGDMHVILTQVHYN